MSSLHNIFGIVILSAFFSCDKADSNTSPDKLLGNKVVNLKRVHRTNYFVDPIDDTLNFIKIHSHHDFVYKDSGNKVYVVNRKSKMQSDSVIYADHLVFLPGLDAASYRDIGNDFFTSNGKVYFWFWGDDGFISIEVKGADALSFVPFNGEHIAGKDKNHQYIYKDLEGFKVIDGADLETFQPLTHLAAKDAKNVYYVIAGERFYRILRGADPKTAEAHMGYPGTYITDAKAVYYNGKVVAEADPETFESLYDKEGNVDAKDKYRYYSEGQPVK